MDAANMRQEAAHTLMEVRETIQMAGWFDELDLTVVESLIRENEQPSNVYAATQHRFDRDRFVRHRTMSKILELMRRE